MIDITALGLVVSNKTIYFTIKVYVKHVTIRTGPFLAIEPFEQTLLGKVLLGDASYPLSK